MSRLTRHFFTFPGIILDLVSLLSSLSLVERQSPDGHCHNVKLWLPQRNLRLLGFGGNNLCILCFILSFPFFLSFIFWTRVLTTQTLSVIGQNPNQTQGSERLRNLLKITQPENAGAEFKPRFVSPTICLTDTLFRIYINVYYISYWN